jgi:hypothetical protein
MQLSRALPTPLPFRLEKNTEVHNTTISTTSFLSSQAKELILPSKMHILTPLLTLPVVVSAFNNAANSSPTVETYKEYVFRPETTTVNIDEKVSTTIWSNGRGPTVTNYYNQIGKTTTRHTVYVDSKGDRLTLAAVDGQGKGGRTESVPFTEAPESTPANLKTTFRVLTSSETPGTTEASYEEEVSEGLACQITCKSRWKVACTFPHPSLIRHPSTLNHLLTPPSDQRYTMEMRNCNISEDEMHDIARDACTVTGFGFSHKGSVSILPYP